MLRTIYYPWEAQGNVEAKQDGGQDTLRRGTWMSCSEKTRYPDAAWMGEKY